MFFSSYCRAQIATVSFTKRVPFCAVRMEAASCLIWRKLVINLTVKSCVGRVQLLYRLHLKDWAKKNCGTLSLFNNVYWCTDRRFFFKSSRTYVLTSPYSPQVMPEDNHEADSETGVNVRIVPPYRPPLRTSFFSREGASCCDRKCLFRHISSFPSLSECPHLLHLAFVTSSSGRSCLP